MARTTDELQVAIAAAQARLAPAFHTPLPVPEDAAEGKRLSVRQVMRGLFRTVEIVVGALGLYGIYLTVQQTGMTAEALTAQKRMDAYQLIYDPKMNARPKMESIQYLATVDTALTGFEVTCRSYRTCYDYAGLTIDGVNLGDGTLSGIRLGDPDLFDVTFERVDLSDTWFLGGSLVQVYFMSSTLRSTQFSTDAVGVTFVDSDLTGANVSQTTFDDVGFGLSNITAMVLCETDAEGQPIEGFCAKGLSPGAFETSYFIGQPPIGSRFIAELDGTMVWSCPYRPVQLDFRYDEDFLGAGCARTPLRGAPGPK